MSTRLGFSVFVLPSDGRPAASVARSLIYTSVEDAIQAFTFTLLSPPLLTYVPPPPEEPATE